MPKPPAAFSGVERRDPEHADRRDPARQTPRPGASRRESDPFDHTFPDRRDPGRQMPLITGRRKTDPNLSTGEIAAQLGLDPKNGPGFVVAEIMAERLKGGGIVRDGLRTIYYATQVDVDRYRDEHLWTGERMASAKRTRTKGSKGVHGPKRLEPVSGSDDPPR